MLSFVTRWKMQRCQTCVRECFLWTQRSSASILRSHIVLALKGECHACLIRGKQNVPLAWRTQKTHFLQHWLPFFLKNVDFEHLIMTYHTSTNRLLLNICSHHLSKGSPEICKTRSLLPVCPSSTVYLKGMQKEQVVLATRYSEMTHKQFVN